MYDIILKMLLYIALYSVCGWILESVYKTILEKKPVNSGFLKGPVCPIYGLGAFIMLLTLNGLKDNPVLLFIIAVLVLTTWEYIVGFLLEKIFKVKYWDYSHLKFNFQGRICLKNSIYWGILGLTFIELIHPFIEDKVNLIPINYILYINIITYAILLLDLIISSIKVLKLGNWKEENNKVDKNIKEQFNELKSQRKNKDRTKKGVKEKANVIRKLKIRQAILKIKLYKTAKRLKDAFPTMKSEKVTEVLNQKIEMESLKEYIKKLKTKIMKR